MGNITANPKHRISREEAIKGFTLSQEALEKMRIDFLGEMCNGWESGHGLGAPADKSSLKMLSSHINILPTGDEEGTFFAVDLGGTNLRVLRVTLRGGPPIVREVRDAIPRHVMSKSSNASELFDFIAKACSKLTTDMPVDAAPLPLGFTFSFPFSQRSIKDGNLIEWTKGFETQGCVGENPAALLQAALDRLQLPLVVDALCNDTVGTLMTNAYQKKSRDCRIGVILGTGTNAAYADPSLDNLIVNIEWGGFSNLPFRTVFDEEVDHSSPNPGKQWLEKMVSGMYLGDLTRLATVDVLRSQGKHVPRSIRKPHGVTTAMISMLLSDGSKIYDAPPFSSMDEETITLLRDIGEAVLDRSSAIAAAALAAVIQRATADQTTMRCEVGIDGSLFTKGHHYNERLMRHLRAFYPTQDILLDFSEDGSGLGAALVAAAIARGRRVSDRKESM